MSKNQPAKLDRLANELFLVISSVLALVTMLELPLRAVLATEPDLAIDWARTTFSAFLTITAALASLKWEINLYSNDHNAYIRAV